MIANPPGASIEREDEAGAQAQFHRHRWPWPLSSAFIPDHIQKLCAAVWIHKDLPALYAGIEDVQEHGAD